MKTLILSIVLIFSIGLNAQSDKTRVEVNFQNVSNVEAVVFTNEVTGQSFVFKNKPGNNAKLLPSIGSYTIEVMQTPGTCTTFISSNCYTLNMSNTNYCELPLCDQYTVFSQCE